MIQYTQDIVDLALGLTTVVDPVQDFTTAVDQGLVAKERREAYESKAFNPSSLGSPCVVQDAFRRLEDRWDSPQSFPPSALRLFAAGHAIHDHYQNVVLPEVLGTQGGLWGIWECVSCQAPVEGLRPKQVCANTCAYRTPDGVVVETTCIEKLQAARARVLWTYQELKVRRPDPMGESPFYGIRGRCDGVWLYQDGTWQVIELKTKDSIQFDSMSKVKGAVPGTFLLKPRQGPLPIPKDIFQGALYPAVLCDLADQGLFPLKSELCLGSLLLYVDRDYLRERPFQIPRDPDFLAKAVDPHIEDVRSLVRMKTPLAGPKACSNRSTQRAKRCPWRLDCFPYKIKKKTPKPKET